MEHGIGMCVRNLGGKCFVHVFVVLDTPLCLSGGPMNLNFVNSEHYPLAGQHDCQSREARLGWR